MARLRVNTIVDRNDNGAPSLVYGATIPSGGTLNISGNINSSGISTVGFLSATNASVGIVTANTFVGDGSGLTQVPTVSLAKSIALRNIIGDPPLRS